MRVRNSRRRAGNERSRFRIQANATQASEREGRLARTGDCPAHNQGGFNNQDVCGFRQNACFEQGVFR